MLKATQRFLTILLLMAGLLYLLFQGFLYLRARNLMPPGTAVAGVDVSGLSREEAAQRITDNYLAPINVYHQSERVQINPADVGFVIDVAGMLDEAEALQGDQDPWLGYLAFVLERPFEPVQVQLRATHDRELLWHQLEMITALLDQPARPPQLLAVADQPFQPGQPGLVTDLEASLPAIEEALYRPDQREAHLVLHSQEAPEFNMEMLKANLQRQIDAFPGIGSIFIMDLETGEEISINGDMAISGLSILKIAIFVEAYRALNGPPNEYISQLLYETAVQSSNYGANLLLNFIAGQPNTYRGADVLTESMRRLGLVNTFMAVPYDAPAVSTRPNTYVTPANSRGDLITVPDPARQTTAEEIGTLLAMIYYCAQGGGTLLAVYPDQLTPEECQAIIDLMVLNEEGNLIRFGVPNDVPVSHKHGWDNITHGDAGIVLSPNRDYVIVEYLHQPGQWLVSDISFPILREISRAVYNYFNFDNPYLGDALFEAERFDPDDPFFQNLNDEDDDSTNETAPDDSDEIEAQVEADSQIQNP